MSVTSGHAHWHVFDAGFRGTSHQHDDKLNFVFYAGGRELIGDPGIYAYKRDAFLPYWRGSLSHNTMAVDGFLLSYEGPMEMTCGDVTFHGTALLLRSDGRRYVQADLVDGTSLRINERPVFSGEAISARTLNRLDYPEP